MRNGTIKRLVMALVVAVVGWQSYARLYAAPVRERQTRLDKLRTDTEAFVRATPDLPAVNRAIRVLESSNLSGEMDTFEHLLRTRLSGLAEGAGLREVVVSHAAPDPVMSPILSSRIRQKAFKEPFRARPDFFEVRGRVSGQGTPVILARMLSLAQSQAWVHRIESVKVTPIGKQRRVLQMELGFSVMFSPTTSLPAGHAPPQTEPGEGLLASAMTLASRPIFRLPDPAPKPEAVAVKQPPSPRPEPTPQDTLWRVSGLILEPTPEAWMVHSTSAQQQVLTLGQTILNATLVGVQHDHAQIQIGEDRYRVPLGRTLAERQPIPAEEPSP